ncbi:MAG: hypothetical protein JHC95_04240 [Solirubrobacteraceae bacterium]|nr:hypothetical protein [Solirubrobacteraceae bacterium]
MAITDVRSQGRRVTISGVARLERAGERIRLTYQATGDKTVAQPVIGPDGGWHATVTRPSSPPPTSNRARYRATLGTQQTRSIKVSRRVSRNDITYDGDRLRIRGRVTKPLAPGARALVTRSDACGRYRTVASLPIARDGTYEGSATVSPKTDEAVFLRMKVRVRTSGQEPATTYSIVRPVVLSP